ncbi:GNAT family N-acetyltransferase [Streptomyces sp. NPDC088261]|uniref:GNAT family N-acetyltransferase n=1 Tax=Streptomyces sp. NPDC088261 TaxID=3365851 RepID=UPI00382BE0EF
MTDADCEAVAEIRVRGWQHAYAGLMPKPFLDAMSVEKETVRRRAYLTEPTPGVLNLVAEDAGRVVGWGCSGPCRDEDVPAGTAEVYALYVRPDRIATGVGRALMNALTAAAEEAGHETLVLWVLKENDRARRFYTRSGLAPDGAEEPYDAAGTPVPEVRYARPLTPPTPSGPTGSSTPTGPPTPTDSSTPTGSSSPSGV